MLEGVAGGVVEGVDADDDLQAEGLVGADGLAGEVFPRSYGPPSECIILRYEQREKSPDSATLPRKSPLSLQFVSRCVNRLPLVSRITLCGPLRPPR